MVEFEVLLINSYNEVMDAADATVYFYSKCKKQWFTPALTSGGKDTATRQQALDSDLCKEKTIDVSEVTCDRVCWLSDGQRGFFKGYLFPYPKPSKPLVKAESTPIVTPISQAGKRTHSDDFDLPGTGATPTFINLEDSPSEAEDGLSLFGPFEPCNRLLSRLSQRAGKR